MTMAANITHCDLLIIGGGPAGLAAGALAADRGLRTVLVDERPTLGGQIYKQPGPGFVVLDAAKMGRDYRRGVGLIQEVHSAGVDVRSGTSVLSIHDSTAVLMHEGSATTTMLRAKRVLLAPGAHDRPVVFPGWTLPGVITAGGAQSLVKTARVIPGNRIAFAGSGPLTLAFPAQLRHYGVNVVLALEAGPPPGPRIALRLLRAGYRNKELLFDGVSYRRQLLQARIRPRYRRIIVRAEGEGRVEEVVHAAVDSEWRIIADTEQSVAVDTVCLGYGFTPSSELYRLVDCSFNYDENLGGYVVVLDEWCRTSIDGVLGAGDGTGVRGSLVAIDQGRIAALGAAMDLGVLSELEARKLAAPIRRRLAAKERFRRQLLGMYRVGGGIYELATPETMVCRCEEITQAQLNLAVDASSDINSVKSYTRAGMGLCQGRNCQRHIAAMIAAHSGTALGEVPAATQRPPVRPVPLGTLADASIKDGGLFTRD
jgi:NADPH-dependent 2,4-dienoyl-CoA reductase/sulfur reductase-like enzyme